MGSLTLTRYTQLTSFPKFFLQFIYIYIYNMFRLLGICESVESKSQTSKTCMVVMRCFPLYESRSWIGYTVVKKVIMFLVGHLFQVMKMCRKLLLSVSITLCFIFF